ncbi:hypothetical protein [Streptomyces sp. NPDC002994]|uniref:hypothetical protein n=1 Tax=Streptomyces sp. NPDC002994 TaxID=3154441 RepID=UPI0033A05926
MKKLFWILAAVALLLIFPGLGSAIAAALTPVIAWAVSQPVLLGFGLGAAAVPHMRRTQPTAKSA